MELEHSFTVPVRRDRAWDLLLDVQRVAPCMPGASLDSVDGDDIKGRIKVKVGPISMTYAGAARFTEKDAEAFVMLLEASGKETRGAGTAAAKVRSVLADEGEQTKVTVFTTLNITGRPAQFGRGVLADVSGRLIGMFAANLAAMITEQGAGPAVEAAGSAAGPAVAGDGAGTDREAAAELVADDAGTDGAAAGPAESADSAAAVPGESANGAAAAPAGGADERVAPSPGAGAGDMTGHTVAADRLDSTAARLDLADLGLSARTAARLRGAGLLTADAIAARSEHDLLAIDGVGRATVREIQASLAARGLALGRSPGATAAAAAALAGGSRASGPADGAAAAAASHIQPARAMGGNEELNLLKVAGLPVLKRALPALAGLIAAALFAIRLRRRSRRDR